MDELPKKPKRVLNVHPSIHGRTGRYLIALKSGKSKKKSRDIAGFAPSTPSFQIERSKSFQVLEKKYYKDEMLKRITLGEIAEEQVKVMKQDDDLSAKNTAIKNTLERIEPLTTLEQVEETVMVILAPENKGEIAGEKK